jgi:AAHS family benzoate transporter-like MFS transporter
MRTIDVSEMIETSKFNRFHMMILFWCGLTIVFDGYDLVVYGTVLEQLMQEWSISPIQAGVINSYGLFGMMIGALICSPIADKLGRKNVILFCVIFFSISMLLCGLSSSPAMFGIFRFMAGIGLGGVMPNVVALMTEYSPKQHRTKLVCIMFSGYSVGAIMAAVLGMFIIPLVGWRTMFLIGAFPLLILPFMYKYLPDSLGFYVAKKQKETLKSLLVRITPEFQPHSDDNYVMDSPKQAGFPVTKLFENRRTVSTLMFWVTSFMILLMIYGLNTWLPKLMQNAGYPLGSSLMFMVVLNCGIIIGSIYGGWLADRFGGKKVLILLFLMGGVVITLLGFKLNMVLLYLFIALAGAATGGAQMLLNAYVSQYYPFIMRSSGIGWAMGIGRIGAIIGPTLGGVLLAMNVPLQTYFLIFGIPGFIGAISFMFIQEKYGNNNAVVNNEIISNEIFHDNEISSDGTTNQRY